MDISIRNNTAKCVINDVSFEADFVSNVIGLMFKKKGRMLMRFAFERKHGIWMPFMKFPIDIIFIDSDKCVVDIKYSAVPINLNPKTWKVYSPVKKCKYILEIDAGLAERKLFKVGDTLEF